MYIIEGNIGAGKSTFLSLVSNHIPSISVGFEPLNNWHSEKSGHSLLKNFYENPIRWAFTLETLAMMSRIKEHQIEQNHSSLCRFVERSIYSGYYCFATNSYRSGFLTNVEWSLYREWFDFLTHSSCNVPQGFIYLKVDPDVAMDRIKKRNRSAEGGITLDYLKSINDLHETFLVEKNDIDKRIAEVPVLVIDCNSDFETNAARLQSHCSKIEYFLNITSQSYVKNKSSREISYR